MSGWVREYSVIPRCDSLSASPPTDGPRMPAPGAHPIMALVSPISDCVFYRVY